jgi:SH3-like domain-containing protein
MRLEDGDRRVLHAIWSRSGKLRVHVASTSKPSESAEVVMELNAEQVERLERFLRDGP